MTLHRHEVMNIASQAADWLRIVRNGDREQQAAFIKWLKESPLHVRETLLAYKVDRQLLSMDPDRQIDLDELFAQVSTNVLPMAAGVAAPPVQHARRSTRWFVAAASVAAVVAALGLQQHLGNTADAFATSIGEQRNFALDDGSVVYLNTQSRMRVRFDEHGRDIYLDDGQALFEVRRDAHRPFRVHAREAVIQALGTQFDVRRYSDRVAVSVVEGAVKVLPSDSRPFMRGPADTTSNLRAGQGTTITATGGTGPIVLIDADAATAWRQQQLVFENAPLAEIVSEFNRYNRAPRLRVEDDEIGAQKFNGVFNARNPESLLTYLAKHAAFSFERHSDEVLIGRR